MHVYVCGVVVFKFLKLFKLLLLFLLFPLSRGLASPSLFRCVPLRLLTLKRRGIKRRRKLLLLLVLVL